MRLLSDAEIKRVVANSAETKKRAENHLALVDSVGWHQISWAKRDDLPIPVKGYITKDIYLGTVLITPNAQGALAWIYPDGVSAQLLTAINKAAYASPDEGFAGFMNGVINDAARGVAFVERAANTGLKAANTIADNPVPFSLIAVGALFILWSVVRKA